MEGKGATPYRAFFSAAIRGEAAHDGMADGAPRRRPCPPKPARERQRCRARPNAACDDINPRYRTVAAKEHAARDCRGVATSDNAGLCKKPATGRRADSLLPQALLNSFERPPEPLPARSMPGS